MRTVSRSLLLLLAAGCGGGSSVTPTNEPTTTKTAKADPWETAAGELRRQTDLGTCRRVLTDLSAAENEPASVPVEWADRLRLAPDERSEFISGPYTPFDAVHLAECFYLRDAARSLDLGNQPPGVQARLLFDWVCRQVYPGEWLIPVTADRALPGPPMPPTIALGRGYGSGLERAYIFLAAARQAGLEACLVGKPGQEQTPSFDPQARQPDAALWAIGVRAGDDILLFDPHRCEPFPAGTTLKKLKADPSPLKPWFEDKTRPWAVTADDVKGATAYVCVPFPAVTGRAKRFDERIANEVGVRMSADPAALTKALEPAAGGPVLLWAPPPQDRLALTRGLFRCTPREDGGTDTSPEGSRLIDANKRAAVPAELFAPPAELTGPGRAAVEPLRYQFVSILTTFLVETKLREKIHRGQFNEAVSFLVKEEQTAFYQKQQTNTQPTPAEAQRQQRAEEQYAGRITFGAAQHRSRTDPGHAAAVRAWVVEANQVYADLSAARLPENRAKLPEAEAQRNQFQRSAPGTQQVLEQAVGSAGMSEVAFLLAMCKHEQAERAEARKGRSADGPARATSAWAAAADAWNRYAAYRELQGQAFPGRAEFTAKLAARAAKLSGS